MNDASTKQTRSGTLQGAPAPTSSSTSEISTGTEEMRVDKVAKLSMKASVKHVSAEASKPNEASDNLTDQPTAIRLDNFNAFYGDFQAIHGISLAIPKNRVTAFIGPSGCGKTTLLRWINRMNDIVPTARAEGVLRIHELDVLAKSTDVVDLRRQVGIVFQKPNPFPKTIYDNVAYGPRLHLKLSRSELDELVEWSLRKAAVWNEVKDRLRKPALGLSGGQQQRVCIARTIATGPEILLMDEPCSALDPISTAGVEDLIYELREQYTIVIVTHNMHQASRVSDTTAFFYQGQVVEYGTTDQIFTRPSNQQTEDYVTGKFG